MDLGAEWRARRWRRLLNLIDGLPGNSHYIQAQMNDEEYVAGLLDGAPDRPRVEQLADWSPVVDKLAYIADLQQQMLLAFLSANGGKPGKFKPLPRPQTAVERTRRRQQQAEYAYLQGMWGSSEDESS